LLREAEAASSQEHRVDDATLAARVSVLSSGTFVTPCVEINQCIRCTTIFTKSFLGDGAAVLARSSGEDEHQHERAVKF